MQNLFVKSQELVSLKSKNLYIDIVNLQSKSFYCGIVFLLLSTFCLNAQQGFSLLKGKKKDRINFELVNNLVVIPVEVNGTKLSFLLDTGVNATIIFSLSENDSLEVKDTTPIKLRGLGEGDAIDGLKSIGNEVRIGDAIDFNHTLYFIFDESLNFSPRMGIPIHGILGYDFFKKFVVQTNYVSKTLKFYDPDFYSPKKCRKCETFNLVFNKNKAFIKVEANIENEKEDLLLLVDTGSSDALWLFNEYNILTEEPKNYFDDFLGLGLSGNIYGKRSRIDKVKLGNFNFKEITVAFPDSISLQNARKFKKRDGSLGGNFFKRFTTIINFTNKKLTLKKNSNFSDPFYYNMSGLTLEHNGLDYKLEKKQERVSNGYSSTTKDANSSSVNTFSTVEQFQFKLVPRYIVAEIRKDSPAFISGIEKGDEVVMINGKQAHQWKLFEINQLFSSKAGKRITMEILDKNGTKKRVRFVLKKVF